MADARVHYGGQEFRVPVPTAEALDNQLWAAHEKGELPKMLGFETISGKRVKVWVSESIPLAVVYPAPEGEPGRGPRRVARLPQGRP